MPAIFDKYDYQTDKEREDTLHVFTNEKVIGQDEDLKILSKRFRGQKTE
jgi:hypothetical protein